ncbi:SsgA family sporulation/cell division regulator [Streptomyces sp. LP05-1]|uniref:SsgA family sporulation/cell division regulator n=1 Tax=Streptomyces pyxinae TaxID=2970734 RepID=A0ABT2CPE9_9ACTN|nr:SsgA family sporulation/cell division regulator [Streptomyces sp. LP05-1]
MIVTEGPLSRPVPVALRYDPDDEPGVVLLGFPGGAEWVLPRALLEDGLRAPAHSGEVDVWPCGRVQTVVEHHSTDGTEIAQFDSAALLRFLRRTYAATASPMTR